MVVDLSETSKLCKLSKMFSTWGLVDEDSAMLTFMFHTRCPGPYRVFWRVFWDPITTTTTRSLCVVVDDTPEGFLWSLEWL